jgi:iron complex transport system substrate-binding protein
LVFVLTITTQVKGEGVISLLPSVTDIIFDLKAGNTLLGVSSYCIVPKNYKLKKLGGVFNPNLEEILKLQPSVVFTYKGATSFEILKKANIKVVYLKFNTLNDIFENYIKIGKIVNKEQLAKEKIAKLKNFLQKQKGKYKKSVLIVLHSDSLLSGEIYCAGANTYFSQVAQKFGLNNIAPRLGTYPVISKEGFLKLNPDIILILSPDHPKTNLCRNTPFAQMKACKTNSVFFICGKKILHPGPSVFNYINNLTKVLKSND